MRRSLRLASLFLLAACGPKVDPIGPLDGTDDTDTTVTAGKGSDTVTADAKGTDGVDGGAFRWADDFSSLDLQNGLAGQPVRESKGDGWETRTTAGGAAPRGRAGSISTGASYDDALDMSVAVDAPSRPRVSAGSSAGYGGGGGSVKRKSATATRAPMAEGRAAAPPSPAEPMMDYDVSGEMEEVVAEAAPRSSRDSARAPRPAPGLKAGTTDDNEHFDAWLTYVGEWGARSDISGWADQLDVTGRRHVQVLDARGRPVPDARVSIVDPTSERVVWAGRAYGDGRVPMYPQLKVPGRDLDIAGDAPAGGWLVQAETPDGAVRSVRWDGQDDELDLIVDSDGLKAGAPVPVDVCFIIDTTGSMGDEIDRVKATLLSVTDKLRSDASQGVDLRYGAVLYRDIGDEYVTRRHAFTTDLQGFDRALQTISAAGGGDGPESLNQGLAVGVAGMDWREGAARVAFVIADAPPHMDYQEDVSYGRAAAAAAHRGIRVHTVAASGLDDRGSFAFRQIAQLTRGQFIYIEYGSAAASAADHGVTGPTKSNNLDDIVYGRIRAEIDGWGKDGTEKMARR